MRSNTSRRYANGSMWRGARGQGATFDCAENPHKPRNWSDGRPTLIECGPHSMRNLWEIRIRCKPCIGPIWADAPPKGSSAQSTFNIATAFLAFRSRSTVWIVAENHRLSDPAALSLGPHRRRTIEALRVLISRCRAIQSILPGFATHSRVRGFIQQPYPSFVASFRIWQSLR